MRATKEYDVNGLASVALQIETYTPAESAEDAAIAAGWDEYERLAAERRQIVAAIMAAHPQEALRMAEIDGRRAELNDTLRDRHHALVSAWRDRANKDLGTLLAKYPESVRTQVYILMEDLYRAAAATRRAERQAAAEADRNAVSVAAADTVTSPPK